MLFKKKKLYKIKYELLGLVNYTDIIAARDEAHAIRKFHRRTRNGIAPTIISFEEYKVGGKL